MGSRAQISTEFFIFIGLAFLIAIAFEIASVQQINELRVKNEDEAVKDLALKIQREFFIASYVEDGYARTFTIPDQLDRIDYALIERNHTITVQSKNSIYIVSVPDSTGNVTKGANQIKKTGGVIYIN